MSGTYRSAYYPGINREGNRNDKKQLEAPENHRRESKIDHRINDARVPKVLYEMKKEMKKDKMEFSMEAVKSMRTNKFFKGT